MILVKILVHLLKIIGLHGKPVTSPMEGREPGLRTAEDAGVAVDPAPCFADLIVDWTTLVTPEHRIHILHGGTEDPFGVQNAVQHLQRTWCMPAVIVKSATQLRELSRTPDRMSKDVRPIVCVPLAVVAEAPAAYDELVVLNRSTCVVTVPVSKLHGPPYSKRGGIVAVVLPSTRLDMDNVHAVLHTYRYPRSKRLMEDIGPGVDGVDAEAEEVEKTPAGNTLQYVVPTDLDHMLWSLPHEYGIAWCIGRSVRPAVIDFSNAVVQDARRLCEMQTLTDRAWWWSRDTGIAGVLTVLPDLPIGLVVARGAPFTPALKPCLRRVSDNTLAFVTSKTRSDLYALRCRHAVATKTYDAHVVDGRDTVVPIRLSLQHAVDTLAIIDGQEVVTLTCRCTFPTSSFAVAYSAPKRTWKTYVGPL